ncbi:MAG: 23S rRNA (adenine(2503)-C(2))-methyltransferase RlmN [Chloroflexota bacterium]
MSSEPGPPATVTAAADPDDAPVVPQPATAPRDPRPGASGVAAGEIAAWLAGRGIPAWRARQVADHLWSGRPGAFADLHVLPPALRAELDATWRAWTLVETTTRTADAGLTDKALHRLDDGRTVESVCMRYPARGPRRERATLCISSQAGCAVGCPFCATGELGFARDLETAEIVDQARYWRGRLAEEGRRVTNVVFMGMGEPFLNTDRVLAAAATLADPAAFGLGARHITISTSGVVPGIERLTELRPQITLAVSLHAARPALRDLLVPLNRRWPVDAVVAAATAYAEATGRRVTYEIVMIDGINDTEADATATAELLRGRLAHVNLIPMNPVAHTPWRPSPPERIEAFAQVLRAVGVDTTIRRNRGTEIGAACGQLAAELAGAPPPAAVARRRELLVVRSAAALRDLPAEAAP